MEQIEYTFDEILADHKFEEPLVIGDVKCHGGFDEDGTYVPPRTLNRQRAIDSWEKKHLEESGMPLLTCPDDMFAEFYPNIPQTKYLLSAGVRQPIIDIITQIGTVEGFGQIIRHVEIPDLQKLFVEDVSGTATSHLSKGLYETHARDEAGFGDLAGHDKMWYIVRDMAFDNPDCGDPMQMMMKQLSQGDGAGKALAGIAQSVMSTERLLPQLDQQAEAMITRMTGLLLIELLAFQTFKWAQEILASEDLSRPEDTTRLVSYIRADEQPHVHYTQVALTEMRCRTFVGIDGKRIPGTQVIDTCWDHSMRGMFGFSGKRSERRDMIMSLLNTELEGWKNRDEILRNFDDLETPDPVIAEKAVMTSVGYA